jgi:rhodanese-related sulfurtransferase
MREISVAGLKALRDGGADHVLLDVREPFELELARVAGSLDIPMGEIADRLAEVPRDRDVVVMCHGGKRSARVTRLLEEHGFTRAVNLEGGIDAWSREIDPSVPTY